MLVTQPLHQDVIDLLSAQFDVQASNKKLSTDEIINQVKDVDALIGSVNDDFNADVIAAGENLKVIANFAVGYNNIDIDAAAKRNILVTNTPNILENSVAEFVFAHMLALSRKLVEADQYVRAGKFSEVLLGSFLGIELKGKTLGIVGFGSIGQTLVPIAKGFGMNILYTNRKGELPEFADDPSVSYQNLDDLLATSDFVVLLTTLNEETRHLIAREEFKKMKDTTILVNMARGPVVKEEDLVSALENGLIAGACLDVYEFEPKVTDKLKEMNNTFLTPHIGSATVETRKKMAACVAQNVIDVLKTGECKNAVNKHLIQDQK